MLDDKLRHWKVFRIPGRKARPYGDRRGRNKAIGLTQRDPFGCVIATPLSGTLALVETESRDTEASKEPADGRLLAEASAAPKLFDIDGTNVGRFRDRTKRAKPIGGFPSAKCVDQNRRVEKKAGHALADTASIDAPLLTYPRRGIGIPLVTFGGDLSEGHHDVVPAAVILQRTADCLRNERAPLAPADPAVELRDQSLVQTNVYTHAHKLAHKESAPQAIANHPGPGRWRRRAEISSASSGHSTVQLNHFPTSS